MWLSIEIVKKKARARPAAAKKAAGKQAAKKVDPVKLKQERFVSCYLLHFNGARAAREAGYSADTARQAAYELLALPEVRAQVQAAQEAFLKRNEATKDMVLQRLVSIATADARDLSELHRGCCRYCWGEGYQFQRTPSELRAWRQEWADAEAERQAKGLPPTEYDEQGGVGFNPKKDPNPACPECFGDGVEHVVFKDTRDLGPDARLLFAGVEQTQHGLKMKINDQKGALVDIGKHLGMFAQKHKLVGGDDGDEPVQVGFVVVPQKTEGEDG